MTDHHKSQGMQDVLHEMFQQDCKWGADRDQHPFVWMTILMEEVGEAAQAALHVEFGGPAASGLRNELVQIAAVALQFIEQLDRKP